MDGGSISKGGKIGINPKHSHTKKKKGGRFRMENKTFVAI